MNGEDKNDDYQDDNKDGYNDGFESDYKYEIPPEMLQAQAEFEKHQKKRLIIRAIIINGVTAALLCLYFVLAFFEDSSLTAFMLCCGTSLLWTLIYNVFAHKKLMRQGKKFSVIYLIIAVAVCGVTLLTLFKLPEYELNFNVTEGTTFKDMAPWLIVFKLICDGGFAFIKGTDY